MAAAETDDDDGPLIHQSQNTLGHFRLLLASVSCCAKRCASLVARSSPVEPCEEVQTLLTSMGMTSRHLLKIYHAFHRIRQSEVDDVVITATEVEFESVQQLVQERRRWVSRLLRCLLRLGGCKMNGRVTWDEFLWIFVRFCGLSQTELCQSLFLFILNELESPTLHYLTKEQLEQFFCMYEKCPIHAFNTSFIDFDKLPLTRYYMSDFAELATRFRQLLNPTIHLQLCLQKHLPGSSFWDFADRGALFTRKMTLEFFTMKRVRVFLLGEPPFRETCDMLAPDALGCEALNQDQWYLRVRNIKQTSVWGEQLTPEKADELAAFKAKVKREAELEAERKAADHKAMVEEGLVIERKDHEKEKKSKETKEAKDKKESKSPYAAGAVSPHAPALPGAMPTSPTGGTAPGKSQGGVETRASKGGSNLTNGARVVGKATQSIVEKKEEFMFNEAERSLYAATLNERRAPPMDVPPPVWMRNYCVFPAPQSHEDKPPPWRRKQLGMYAEAFDDESTRLMDVVEEIDDESASGTTRNHVKSERTRK
eukprot:TRINITY_DN44294_c0_g1_i1.p1 TRINITY_DN44294_c0_g1~~TRINITY_DN44294_c0_g1_i1.p1  ORF type:complete len:539 (+),score=96.63 TRINITY_DN44294_c0_g1_i1:90-1706(+)